MISLSSETTTTILYSAWFCPFAQRVWCALNELDVSYQLVESLQIDPTTHAYIKDKGLLEANPKGLVPTLVQRQKDSDTVTTVCDSMEILKQIHAAKTGCSSDDETASRLYQDAMEWNKRLCSTTFYEVLMKQNPQERDQAWKDLVQGLQDFSQHLMLQEEPNHSVSYYQAPNCASGEEPSMVDFCVFPFVHRLYIIEHYKGYQLDQYLDETTTKKLQLWKDQMESLPSVQATLAKPQDLIPVYERYADGTAKSKMADSVRQGGRASEPHTISPNNKTTNMSPAAPEEKTAAPEEKALVNNDGDNALRIRAEFVLSSKPDNWAEIPVADSPKELVDDRDNPNKGKNSKKQQQNKKRPRDARLPNAEKVCLALVRGDKCPYGETCRFSHDLLGYMRTRPEDINVMGVEGCPNFNESGYCLFGALCRMGSCHLIKSTGENLRKDGVVAPPPIQNVLPKEVLLQLRKRKYKFKTSRAKKGKAKEEEGKAKEEEGKATEEKKESPEPAKIDDPFRPWNHTPLPSKTKKAIDFSNKIYIAPLTTVGNLPFRRIMKKFGADITCGEMAVAGNLLEGKPSEWALLKRHHSETLFGVQIASGFPDQATRVAEVIESHMDVDFLDFNLGCPLDIICNKSAGASLMRKHNNLKSILAGVTNTLSCPVTIKMRTGWDRENHFAHKLVHRIQSWGYNDSIAAIMVHGRSRLQRYEKLADWDYISLVHQSQEDDLSKLHVIGNGDILSFTDYEERTSKPGLSSCAMLARGALIKPWLPTEIKERRHWDISATERLDILKDFVKFGLSHWGSDQHGVDNTRRFLLEWLSFLHRYYPIGIMEGGVPQKMNMRPPAFMCGRNDLETLFLSPHSKDWIRIAEMLLGPVPEGFQFEPKHKARSYATN